MLLTEVDCVILPGFGGFIGNYDGAKIHPITHVFSPPSKTIAFNARLSSNDGLLIDFIASEEKISKDLVTEKLDFLIKEIHDKIQSGKEFLLNGIGKIFLNENNSIQFEPESERFELVDSYGLAEFFAKPIEREASIKLRNKQSDIMSDPRPKRPVRPGNSGEKSVMRKKVPVEKKKVAKKEKGGKSGGGKTWLVIVLVVVLLLGGGSGYLVTQTDNFSLSSLSFWNKDKHGSALSSDASSVSNDGESTDGTAEDDANKWDTETADETDGSESDSDTDVDADAEKDVTVDEIDEGRVDELIAESEGDVSGDLNSESSDTDVEGDDSNTNSDEVEDSNEESDESADATSETSKKTKKEMAWYESAMAWVKGLFGGEGDKGTGEDYEDIASSKENGWADDTDDSSNGSSDNSSDESPSDIESGDDSDDSGDDEVSNEVSEPVVEESSSSSSYSSSSSSDVTISSKTNRYYVIAGAFEDPINARKYRDKLAAKGYDSKILEPRGEKNVHRVTLADYSGQQEGIRKSREENEGFGNALWVLRY